MKKRETKKLYLKKETLRRVLGGVEVATGNCQSPTDWNCAELKAERVQED